MLDLKYNQRGVSADKEDVHNAIKNINKGIFPNAFCKIVPDILGSDEAYCNIMHADGAGTKSSLAYVYWKETGDLSVWRGIAQDAIIMNIDDLLSNRSQTSSSSYIIQYTYTMHSYSNSKRSKKDRNTRMDCAWDEQTKTMPSALSFPSINSMSTTTRSMTTEKYFVSRAKHAVAIVGRSLCCGTFVLSPVL